MRPFWVNLTGSLLVLAGLGIPILIGVRQQQQLRRFHVVREGVLYRSAQLSLAGLKRLIRDHGIRTVVNLRDGSTVSDQEEQRFCQANGIRFVRIAPLSWDGVQGSTPIDEGLRTFLDTLRKPEHLPVLVHCYRGVHRTGQYCAVYRIEYEGWSVPEALAEMVELGYNLLDEHADVRRYFASYQRTGRYHRSAQLDRSGSYSLR